MVLPLMAGAPMSAAFCGEGTGPPAAPTATLEKLAEASAPCRWLVTASPTYTVLAIEMLSEPISVQVTPSADRWASNRVPVRISRTHPGAAPAPPLVCALDPPVV